MVQTRPLICHPAAANASALASKIGVSAAIEIGPNALTLTYQINADRKHIAFPKACANARETPFNSAKLRRDDLWKTTCFEAFLAPSDTPAYYEINCAPSGHWAAYRFSSYRQGQSQADIDLAAPVDVAVYNNHITLHAVLRMPFELDEVRIGLSAVVEERAGPLSYWALHHPKSTPDFHDPEGFCLPIAEAKAL
ncbi:MAG: DOMON-like domain-containing protein [Pseudomonadota bacterium]